MAVITDPWSAFTENYSRMIGMRERATAAKHEQMQTLVNLIMREQGLRQQEQYHKATEDHWRDTLDLAREKASDAEEARKEAAALRKELAGLRDTTTRRGQDLSAGFKDRNLQSRDFYGGLREGYDPTQALQLGQQFAPRLGQGAPPFSPEALLGGAQSAPPSSPAPSGSVPSAPGPAGSPTVETPPMGLMNQPSPRRVVEMAQKVAQQHHIETEDKLAKARMDNLSWMQTFHTSHDKWQKDIAYLRAQTDSFRATTGRMMTMISGGRFGLAAEKQPFEIQKIQEGIRNTTRGMKPIETLHHQLRSEYNSRQSKLTKAESEWAKVSAYGVDAEDPATRAAKSNLISAQAEMRALLQSDPWKFVEGDKQHPGAYARYFEGVKAAVSGNPVTQSGRPQPYNPVGNPAPGVSIRPGRLELPAGADVDKPLRRKSGRPRKKPARTLHIDEFLAGH